MNMDHVDQIAKLTKKRHTKLIFLILSKFRWELFTHWC